MIKIIINTELTWEEDNELRKINTSLYQEVGGGIVTLYAEHEGDIPTISMDIQKIRKRANDIRRALA